MAFKDSYPDFAAIEEHIRRARIERSVAVAQFIADFVAITWRGISRLPAVVRGWRTAFVKRPLPSD